MRKEKFQIILNCGGCWMISFRPTPNHFFAAPHDGAKVAFVQHLDPVPMRLGKAVSDSGDLLRDVYFALGSIESLLHVIENEPSAELSDVTNDGVTWIAWLIGRKLPRIARLFKVLVPPAGCCRGRFEPVSAWRRAGNGAAAIARRIHWRENHPVGSSRPIAGNALKSNDEDFECAAALALASVPAELCRLAVERSVDAHQMTGPERWPRPCIRHCPGPIVTLLRRRVAP